MRKLVLLGVIALAVSGAMVTSSATAEHTTRQQPTIHSGVFALANVNSGKCLEIAFSGLWDFNAANQYGCTFELNQGWFLRAPGS